VTQCEMLLRFDADMPLPGLMNTFLFEISEGTGVILGSDARWSAVSDLSIVSIVGFPWREEELT
jgi:hypothetical protein